MRTLPGASAKGKLEVTVATMTVAMRLALTRTVSDPVSPDSGVARSERHSDLRKSAQKFAVHRHQLCFKL